jgi:Leucine-rich repeat (LRR) protein
LIEKEREFLLIHKIRKFPTQLLNIRRTQMSNISISDLASNADLDLADLSGNELNQKGGFFGGLLRGIGRVAKVVASIV